MLSTGDNELKSPSDPIRFIGKARIEQRFVQNMTDFADPRRITQIVRAALVLVLQRIALRPEMDHHVVDAADLHVKRSVRKRIAASGRISSGSKREVTATG